MHIFIATYNGGKFLKDCLESLEKNCKISTVIVINNNSDDEETLQILNETKFKVDTNLKGGYDTGAYLYAIKKYLTNDTHFLFCHDDVVFKPNFEEFMLRKLQHCDVLALSTFIGKWDSQEQKDICMQIVGMKEFVEKKCIFGPIFFTTNRVIRKLQYKNLLNYRPSNKLGQQAMERGWGYMFDAIEAKIDELVPFPKTGEPLNENNHDTVITHRWQRKQ